MIIPNIQPRQWNFMMLLSAIVGILFSIFSISVDNGKNIVYIVDILLFTSGIFYQIYCIKNTLSYKKALTFRIFTDHTALFITAIFIYPQYNDVIFFLYIIQTWLDIVVIITNDLNEKILKFIKFCTILIVPLSLFFAILSPSRSITVYEIVFIFFDILTFILIIYLYRSYKYNKKEEENKSELKKIEKTLLKHNFGNMASIVSAFADCDICDIDDKYTKTIHRAIDIIGSIIDTICSEDSNIPFRLQPVIERTVSGSILRYNCIIVKKIEHKMILNTNLCSFLNSISVFINNACEANSKLINIYIENNRYLHIDDDGDGFDMKKIKNGYTTKSYGWNKCSN